MGIVLVTFKIMPETVETDLDKIGEEAKVLVEKFEGKFVGLDKEPIAFGLNALVMRASFDEKSDLEVLEDNIRNIEGVISVDVTDMRRAVG